METAVKGLMCDHSGTGAADREMMLCGAGKMRGKQCKYGEDNEKDSDYHRQGRQQKNTEKKYPPVFGKTDHGVLH